MAPAAEFTWIPFFEEWADKLLPYKDRQRELIDLLESLRSEGHLVPPLQDQDASGARFLMRELDPFTFIGAANRGIRDANRIRLLEAMKKFFEIEATVPRDFRGVPVLNNMMSRFLPWSHMRSKTAVPTLWEVFELSLGPNPLQNEAFARAFDAALALRLININLTMGLFWIRPRTFLSLDSVMREHFEIRMPRGGLTFAAYRAIMEQLVASHGGDFAALSYDAWLHAAGAEAASDASPAAIGLRASEPTPVNDAIDYWMVGAFWDDRDPQDQTSRFVSEGVWENGYEDRYLDVVRAMKPGDRIAIKAATTQRNGLPFDNRGATASKMVIKATGTVLKNHGDGRVVEVEWDAGVAERSWYFYTSRLTVWRLNKANELAQRLIRFTFHGESQDYDYFLRIWNEGGEPVEEEELDAPPPVAASQATPFGVDDVIAAGAFLRTDEVERILERLERKKNLILQGAPGVGKTFLARLLAYALIQARDDARITYVQFHPSYTYEDFVRGYRPTPEAGKFELVEGPLLQACAAAALDPDRPYVLLVDEVNRGNTSQIFGELLSLIETDKRGGAHAVVPLYRRNPNERLSVPENLYVIGTMNIADRSLALVDYALRRRFAFVTLEPRYDALFERWAKDRQMSETLLRRIRERMNALNAQIAADSQLGAAFRVGHSFFCPRGTDFSELDGHWFDDIVDTEIVPLLEEYWYDAPEKARAAAEALRAG